ncbi:MAG: nitroreductase family protein, partial [Bacteroidales bacterium]|nr:nitroreductase family protein [Bacteroidales bacterium]
AQSILLKAVEAGLGGIFILNFKAEDIRKALELPMEPIGIIGLGKPSESVFIVDAESPEKLDYYRKGGAHFVPKLKVEDILI